MMVSSSPRLMGKRCGTKVTSGASPTLRSMVSISGVCRWRGEPAEIARADPNHEREHPRLQPQGFGSVGVQDLGHHPHVYPDPTLPIPQPAGERRASESVGVADDGFEKRQVFFLDEAVLRRGGRSLLAEPPDAGFVQER